jgi:predicted acyltransferase
MSQTTAVPAASPAPRGRLDSLDVFRGITIAGMILVNNPGSWRAIYKPLGHAPWDGCTPTDLVFPFFLFIVGVAMTFSFRKRLTGPADRGRLYAQIARRTLSLFLLGLIMYGFPNWRLMAPYILGIVGLSLFFQDRPAGSPGRFRPVMIVGAGILVGAILFFAFDFAYFQEKALRVPGVLQRIAVCYCCTAVILLTTGLRGRVAWVLGILVAYWVIALHVPAPQGYTAKLEGSPGLLHNWVDEQVLGNHLYGARPDPEGILSTLPAIATVLLGVLVGHWLQSERERGEKAAGMFFAGVLAIGLGLLMDKGFPINKKIWSSSYVVYTGGLACCSLAICYWLIDIHGIRRWAWPFRVFGTNAIVVYFASSIGARLLTQIRWPVEAGEITLKGWVYKHWFLSWTDGKFASMAFALSYVTLWLLLMIPLYWRRIFVKI